MDIGQFRSLSNVPSSGINTHKEDDEEALKWAVLERLPTYERARKGLLHGIAGDFKEIDLQKLGSQEKKDLLESWIKTGEMLVGPVNVLFMDNISTGLDSSTTFQIVDSLKQSIHIFNKSAIISLLQPPPETFELFDDVILLAEGQIVYQGPREYILEFFEFMGFKCPERKGVADYRHISVSEFAESFKSFHVSRAIQRELATPFDRSKSHPAALAKSKYGNSKKELLKACLAREFTLMKRMASVCILRLIQMQFCALCLAAVFSHVRNHRERIEDGAIYMSVLFSIINTITFSGFPELPMIIDKLPVFYKQRDHHFYPSWAFSVPASILGIPVSIIEVFFWVAITYYSIGFDPNVQRPVSNVEFL